MKALCERPPTVEEVQKAQEATEAFRKAITSEGSLPIKVIQDGNEIAIELPPAVGALVMDLLTHISREEMVTFVPYGVELTTQQAADILNVSRPFLIKLLEGGEISFHKVGSHRKVKLPELLKYKQRRESERSEALDKLQQLGQEFDAS